MGVGAIVAHWVLKDQAACHPATAEESQPVPDIFRKDVSVPSFRIVYTGIEPTLKACVRSSTAERSSACETGAF